MVTNRADHRGFITEGPVDGTTTTRIDNYIRKYEFHQTLSSQTVSGTGYTVLRFPGDYQSLTQSLSTWSTSSNTFFPATRDQLYSFRIDFTMSASNGTPVLHLCLDRIGTVVTGVEGGHVGPLTIHRQEIDSTVVKGTRGHSHLHWYFSLIADSTLFASGAQFYVETDAQPITISSASVLVKEG